MHSTEQVALNGNASDLYLGVLTLNLGENNGCLTEVSMVSPALLDKCQYFS
jgi:hypothetical protein